jgi:putative ribosome biogenesis GTPase RsgA
LKAVRVDGTRPFRGPDYYRTQHRHLFFGRGADAAALVSVAAGLDRLTLLHASSGAGKTSLVNALLIPVVSQFEIQAAGCRFR